MKNLFLSLAVIATLTVVSCKDKNVEATEEVATEVVDTAAAAVTETVEAAAASATETVEAAAASATEEVKK